VVVVQVNALRRDDLSVGEQVPCIVKADDAIAPQAPALLGVAGDDVGGVAVSRGR
jgi:hypothetical protein